MFPFGLTVTVQHREQDRKGNRTTTGTDTVADCAWAPGASTEDMQARDEVAETGMLYMPPNSVTSAYDRVVLPDGTTYEVNGTPSAFQNPFTGWAPGVAVPLKRITG
jgi:hypothetical protein